MLSNQPRIVAPYQHPGPVQVYPSNQIHPSNYVYPGNPYHYYPTIVYLPPNYSPFRGFPDSVGGSNQSTSPVAMEIPRNFTPNSVSMESFGSSPFRQQPQLFVSNVAYSVREEHFQHMFYPFGSVLNARLVRNNNVAVNGNPHRGYGFVTYSDNVSAYDAIEKLYNSPTGNERRLMKIDVTNQFRQMLAQKNQGLLQKIDDFINSKRAEEQTSNAEIERQPQVFISNIAYRLREENLKEIFGAYGKIEDLYLIHDPRTGVRHNGYGFVRYESDDSAKNLVKTWTGGENHDGRRISVAFSKAFIENDQNVEASS